MNLKDLNKIEIENLINNFIKKTKTERIQKFVLDTVYFSDEIDCWIASLSERWTDTHSNSLGEVVSGIDETYAEIFLGKRGIINYVFNESAAYRLSKEWLEFLASQFKTDGLSADKGME